ncbi:zinc transporter ZIP10 [Trichonephila clavata]|uniref:Zinc transporter ZIP10 n=1 Tax=Trichonephila clavata TaxID=2740835 RepID=A0A8X6FZP7_TRICU|nr:zinc transporter ZIP10 [Trichonephila clavata]
MCQGVTVIMYPLRVLFQENKGHGHSHAHLPDELPTLISVKTKSETQLPVSRDQSNSSLDTEIVEVEAMKKPPNLMVNKPLFLGLTSLAIVVTLGDSIHNFGDGLAIGAAFSTGIRGGLSTSIAVFCHELPHEFGDFVVLLSTGLSFSKALWINFLSGLTCFAGLYIGIYIGDNEVARQWVMAVTAGIFLYVALGEMLPELREHHQGSRVKMLVVKNIGILAGIAIMVLISIYEQELV